MAGYRASPPSGVDIWGDGTYPFQRGEGDSKRGLNGPISPPVSNSQPRCLALRTSFINTTPHIMSNPRVSIAVNSLSITFYMEEQYAAKVTKSDLHEMVMSAVRNHQIGLGVQIVCNEACQWSDMGPDYAKSDPIFAEVFIEGPWDDEIEINDCDDEFTALLDENPDICG